MNQLEETMIPQTKCYFCEHGLHSECAELDGYGKFDGHKRDCVCWTCWGMYQDPTKLTEQRLESIVRFAKDFKLDDLPVFEEALRFAIA